MTIRILVLGLLMLVGWSGGVRGEDTTDVRWKFAVRVAGAVNTSLDSDDSFFHSGVGYNLQLMVPISKSLSIVGNFGKAGTQMDDLPQFYHDGSFTTYASNVEYTHYRYTIGIRNNSESLFGWKAVKVFWDVTAGKLHHVYSGKVLMEDSTGLAGYSYTPKWHDPKLLVELEVGLQKRITSSLAAEVGFRRYISINKRSDGGTTMNQDFGFCFGVTVGVGKKK